MVRLNPIKRAEKIESLEADARLPWVQDEKGYFLIRVLHDEGVIEVGYCTNDDVIRKSIKGRDAEGLYHKIISLGLVSRTEHAAYLGKELCRAELALKNGLNYVQDKKLNFRQPAKRSKS